MSDTKKPAPKGLVTYSDFTHLVLTAKGSVDTDDPKDVVIRIPKSSFADAFGFKPPRAANEEEKQKIEKDIKSKNLMKEKDCGCG